MKDNLMLALQPKMVGVLCFSIVAFTKIIIVKYMLKKCEYD